MTDSLTGIIDQLEQRNSAIERALAALREVGFTASAAQIKPTAAVSEGSAGKRKKFSAAARKRMALAQKARWAKIKSEVPQRASSAPEPSEPKRRISPEGMKRIIAATKKRWRLQRAAAKAASAPAQKVAAKKAVAKTVPPVRKAAVKETEPAPAPTPDVVQAAG
jgi:hypothetical protein